MTDTYVIRGRKQAWDKPSQYIYDVYADSATGFVDFCADHAVDMSPASTVEIDDTKSIMRLRLDGSWSLYQAYGEATEDGTDPATAAEEAAAAAFLDDMVSDEEMEAYLAEQEASA